MGNQNTHQSHSKAALQKQRDEYGNIFIKTDKPFYTVEETVTGTVYIDLLKDFPGNIAYLFFKGEENSYWTVVDKEDPDGYKETYHSNLKFLNNKFVVYDWHG